MESDIVARLRAVLHIDRSVELMNREAADEIERLRAERDEARRDCCRAIGSDWGEDPRDIAEREGWDCFPEATP